MYSKKQSFFNLFYSSIYSIKTCVIVVYIGSNLQSY